VTAALDVYRNESEREDMRGHGYAVYSGACRSGPRAAMSSALLGLARTLATEDDHNRNGR
jgi:hypothetical protein